MVNIQFGTYTPEGIKSSVIALNIAIFFDGTKNNKNNTDARLKRVEPENKIKAAEAYKDFGKEITDNNSYNIDWSNVARLWDNYNSVSRIYIEGIGTDDFKVDSKKGYIYGSGSTGIKKRVINAAKLIVEKIKPLAIKNKGKSFELTLDIFGFR